MKKPTRLQEYEKHVRYWIDAFGITDWIPKFEWIDKKDGEQGHVSYNRNGRICTFRICRDHKSDARTVKMLALHEVIHLLLADLSGLAEERIVQDIVSGEEHKIIARIENLLDRGIR